MMNCHTQVRGQTFFFCNEWWLLSFKILNVKLWSGVKNQILKTFSFRIIVLYRKCYLKSTLSLGCCPVSVSSGGGLHDCVQSSSRAEQVDQSRSSDMSEHLSWPFCFSCLCSHDAMDSFYDYIWDITILEYLTRILSLLIHEATLTFNCHVNVWFILMSF